MRSCPDIPARLQWQTSSTQLNNLNSGHFDRTRVIPASQVQPFALSRPVDRHSVLAGHSVRGSMNKALRITPAWGISLPGEPFHCFWAGEIGIRRYPKSEVSKMSLRHLLVVPALLCTTAAFGQMAPKSAPGHFQNPQSEYMHTHAQT